MSDESRAWPGWQEIESAPRGGAVILAWCPGTRAEGKGRVHAGIWLGSKWVNLAGRDIAPSHWLPILVEPGPRAGNAGEES